MKMSRLDQMVGGWFMGDFSPALLRTPAAEVACKHYVAGDYEPPHVHKVATELTLLVSGRAQMNGIDLAPGQLVMLAPGEAADFRALENSITVVVKTPSVIGDKYPVSTPLQDATT